MVDVAGSIGSVVSPVLQVAEWLAAPIWRQFKYLFNNKSNFDNLQEEIDKLKNTRDEVQHKVTAAEKNVEEIKQNVKDWQKDVEKTVTEAEQLIQAKANNSRCFKGLCPNFITSYKQSKKAFKLKQDDIDPLLRQEKELGPVSYPTNPPEIWLRSSEDYLAFESRNSTVKDVWNALNDENVFMIGVYGMGGLGKTTLVQELGRKAKEEKLFEEIVFVEVSESPDVKKIQTTIAEKLGVEFKKESEMANKIYSRMKDKNILLILDNIWEPLEFEKMIGIPCGVDRGRNKLLFTTRNLDVLERMGSTNNFRMGILNEEEAWTLFTKMTGNIIQTRELHSQAKDVCKECKGLPIVICTMAKALKNKSHPSYWKCALQELRAPSPRKYTRYLEEDYAKIALSYKYLRDDELKKTFLISSLMKNNTSISDLFRHVVCLDVFDGANLTMEEARDRLDILVCDLKDACLLLDGFKSGQFAMHDVVRAVAITIAYMDHHVFTVRNDVERDWKDRDKLKKCTMISLPSENTIISQLWPNDLDCPNLEYFYMGDSSFKIHVKIPEDFFMVMPNLRVLNLERLWQSSLPSSIDLLTNLQTLCLDSSKVEDFAIIGKLKTLKVLSLQRSNIKEFPAELGQLTQLRLLDLNYCRRLEVIAPNVISQLSKLEEFYIKGCPIKWKDGVLKELKLLSNLTNLELDIEVNNVLPKDFVSKKLRRYKITIRGKGYGDPINKYSRIFAFACNSTISQEELGGINDVEVLHIVKSSDDEEDLDEKQMLPLFKGKVIFTNLMALKLTNISFGKIWESQLSISSYQNLTQLILKRCDKMKYVFPFFIVKSLQQLKYLMIKKCKVLEKIVEEEEGAEVVDSIFPQLMKLELRFLPKLTVFYLGVEALELPMLNTLKISYCPNFTSTYQSFQDNNEEGEVQVSGSKSICLEHKINSDLKVFHFKDGVVSITWESQSKTLETSVRNLSVKLLQNFNNLKVLKVCRSLSKEIKSLFDLPYLEVLDIDSCYRMISLPTFSTYFLPLKVLKLSYCHGLIKRLITPSMAKSLVHLREMSIYRCNLLTEVVEDEADVTTTNIGFHSLEKLSLKKLDSLTCFCSGNYSFNFPSLRVLVIKGCLNMKTFCLGFLSTPRLHNVNYENELVEIGENDLNTSVQQSHKKRVNSDLSKLSLSGRDIMSIW
ncbi:probable disease resistance protein At4g27220 isoform X2 [Mangifera indica]|uniref:probable disease resistance protein At4g27220 isoform X2 n=1 Tax=Mangifera indica TaxID=29780 RepID=UPI001CFC1888|nr:probable disease resistance protein At4g27220 isoform X2 [Mangifera indica]